MRKTFISNSPIPVDKLSALRLAASVGPIRAEQDPHSRGMWREGSRGRVGNVVHAAAAGPQTEGAGRRWAT